MVNLYSLPGPTATSLAARPSPFPHAPISRFPDILHLTMRTRQKDGAVGRLIPVEARDDELEFVQAAVQGDILAFDALARSHSQRIFRLAFAMLGNRDDAADIQQDTLVTAFRNLGTFRGESSFGTWIYKIASRLCLARRRRSAHRREEPFDVTLWLVPDPGGTPESKAVAAESAREVRSALAKMAPNDHLLIVLKCVEQLSHAEIAAILGCSEESSRSRLARAKRIFRDLYGEVE